MFDLCESHVRSDCLSCAPACSFKCGLQTNFPTYWEQCPCFMRLQHELLDRNTYLNKFMRAKGGKVF